MQNCPQLVIAHFAILRANAVVVPVNPMNRAEELKHYITDPDAKVAITTGDLAAEIAKASDALPPSERLAHLIVTQFTDAFDPDVRGDDARAAAWRDWLLTRHPLPALDGGAGAWPGPTRWPPAMPPPAHVVGAGRHGAAALHQRHHRPAQGLHAPPLQPDAQRRGQRALGPSARPKWWRWRWCRCSTSPAW